MVAYGPMKPPSRIGPVPIAPPQNGGPSWESTGGCALQRAGAGPRVRATKGTGRGVGSGRLPTGVEGSDDDTVPVAMNSSTGVGDAVARDRSGTSLLPDSGPESTPAISSMRPRAR